MSEQDERLILHFLELWNLVLVLVTLWQCWLCRLGAGCGALCRCGGGRVIWVPVALLWCWGVLIRYCLLCCFGVGCVVLGSFLWLSMKIKFVL